MIEESVPDTAIIHCGTCAQPISEEGQWVRIRKVTRNPHTGRVRRWYECEPCHAERMRVAVFAKLAALAHLDSLYADFPEAPGEPAPGPELSF